MFTILLRTGTKAGAGGCMTASPGGLECCTVSRLEFNIFNHRSFTEAAHMAAGKLHRAKVTAVQLQKCFEQSLVIMHDGKKYGGQME
jgi:hypothetical protein